MTWSFPVMRAGVRRLTLAPGWLPRCWVAGCPKPSKASQSTSQTAGQLAVSILSRCSNAGEQSLVRSPDMRGAISERRYQVGEGVRGAGDWAPDNPNARMLPMFVETLGTLV